MSKERFSERKSELQNAVKRLREAVAQPENDLVRDAIIQRGIKMNTLTLRDKDLAILRGAFRRFPAAWQKITPPEAVSGVSDGE